MPMPSKLNQEQQLCLIEDYKAGMLGKDLLTKYGIGTSTLYKILNSHEVPQRVTKLSEEEETQLLQEYAAGKALSTIAAMLGRDVAALRAVLVNKGIRIKQASEIGPKTRKTNRDNDQEFQQKRNAIVEDYIRGLLPKDICEKHDIAMMTLYAYLKALNVPKRVLVLTPEIEQAMVDLYLSGKTTKEIGRMYDSNGTTVINVLKRHDVERKSVADWLTGRVYEEARKKKKYKRNSNAFVDAHTRDDASYFLGLLLTDGCVQQKRTGSPSIALSQAEGSWDVVYKLAAFLETDTPVRIVIRKGETNRRDQAGIVINDQQLFDSLVSYGIHPRKTSKQVVDERLQWNCGFWRGVLDGDGSYYWTTGGRPGLFFGNTSRLFVDAYEKFVRELVGDRYKAYDHTIPSGKIQRQIHCQGLAAVSVARAVHLGGTVSMDRKRLMAEEFRAWGRDYWIKKRSAS